MLLRDRLLARLADMGDSPDYVLLATEVLGIRNAPQALARRLVEQALVVEDRRESWLRTGARVCAAAPASPGVYVMHGEDGAAIYVGKANNIRSRLRAHFAPSRWRTVGPAFARVADVTWQVVGSEIEALVLEAEWIRDRAPSVNVQVREPALDTRAVPPALVRDTLLVLPSAEEGRVVLLAARAAGEVRVVLVCRDGVGLEATASSLWAFFRGAVGADADGRGLAPLVYSWLSGRGGAASRLDPHDAGSARELRRRLELLLRDTSLFADRIVVVRSGFRSTSKRP